MKKSRAGFTILETVLVLAIATLLFMSVTIGIGSRIATSRYETAANEATDYFRNIYTVTLNTENDRHEDEDARNYCTLASAAATQAGNTLSINPDFFVEGGNTSQLSTNPEAGYPGRSACAIYGKIIFFGAEDEATISGSNQTELVQQVHIFDVVGEVVSAKKENYHPETNTTTSQLEDMQNYTTLEALAAVHADYLAAVPLNANGNFCYISPAGSHTTYQPDWGTKFTTANYGENTGRESNTPFVGMIMIVRSPITGDVSTFFHEFNTSDIFYRTEIDSNLKNINDYTNQTQDISCTNVSANEISRYSLNSLIDKFDTDEANIDPDNPVYSGFCLSSNDFYVSAAGLKKFIEFIPNGQNAAAIKLNESDVTDPKEENYNPCRR